MEKQLMKETTDSQNTLHMDVKENHSNSSDLNSEMVTANQIEDTPFSIVGSQAKGYFIAFGKYRVSEPQETEEEALNHFNGKPWNILINTITAIINLNKELNNDN